MSEKKTARKLEDAIIKDISIHSSYIPALQSMLLYYIDQVYPQKEDLAGIFAKFNKIVTGELTMEDAELTWYEHHTWVLYSLLQSFGQKANEQELYQDTNVKYDTDVLGKLTKSILDGDEETQKDLYQKLFTEVSKNKSS
tara:strand:+ start:1105 stop:1524 length:420 start_codon:yes stop_codon:yes gene_type:complete